MGVGVFRVVVVAEVFLVVEGFASSDVVPWGPVGGILGWWGGNTVYGPGAAGQMSALVAWCNGIRRWDAGGGNDVVLSFRVVGVVGRGCSGRMPEEAGFVEG